MIEPIILSIMSVVSQVSEASGDEATTLLAKITAAAGTFAAAYKAVDLTVRARLQKPLREAAIARSDATVRLLEEISKKLTDNGEVGSNTREIVTTIDKTTDRIENSVNDASKVIANVDGKANALLSRDMQ